MTTATPPLRDRRALVIGGSSGIGLASARLLARDGAQVTIAGRDPSRLESAAAALRADCIAVDVVTCDATDGPSVHDAVNAADDDEGRLHIAVVVPGSATVRPVLLMDDDRFRRDLDDTVMPVFLALKHAGRAMVRAGSGSFIAISSTAADFSARYLSSYAAGKAAVDQLVRVAADELGQYGIRVNAVRPG